MVNPSLPDPGDRTGPTGPPGVADAPGESDLASACLAALADLSALLRGRFASVGEPYGIPSVPALRLLVRLERADRPLLPSALARDMHLTRGALTQMLQTLERRGLVGRERDPGDGRTSAAVLTDEGRKSVAEFAPLTRRHEEEICAVLVPGEQRTLLDILTRLRAHVLEMDPLQ